MQNHINLKKFFKVVSHYKKAILHLRLIERDLLMRQGIALMAWRTFVAKKFLALAKLIEKVGKAPKDRLLRKVNIQQLFSSNV